MRIQDIDRSLKKIVEPTKKEVNKKTDKTDKSSEITDKVNFSDTLKETEKLVIDILDYPQDRTEKIEKLKQMIKSGNYNVDVHKLANKIVEDLLFGSFYK